MDEASLCNRVALLQEGKILDIDSPEGITKKFRKPLWAVKSKEMFRLMQDLKKMNGVESCFPFGQEHHITANDANDMQRIEKDLLALGHTELKVKRIEATIEDSFMELMR